MTASSSWHPFHTLYTYSKTNETRFVPKYQIKHTNPIKLALLRLMATPTTTNQANCNRSTAMTANRIHRADVKYSEYQNTLRSTGFATTAVAGAEGAFPGCANRDSKTQCELPSGRISFHQRSPTNFRPLTFFTVQKSMARSKTIRMKKSTKELKKPPRMYKSTATERKNK